MSLTEPERHGSDMALIPLAEMEQLLASPCCRAPLSVAARVWTCGRCAKLFSQTDRWPILIDFDRSIVRKDSVNATAAPSSVPRASASRWRRALKPSNNSAAANIVRMTSSLPPDARVLVVGGGTVGEGLGTFYDSGLEIVAFDIYGSDSVQVVADGHQMPFCDLSFDAVLIQAVLEHVLDPAQVVAEVWRVLKTDGLVYAETPFMQPVHEGPFDFQRFTESGHRWLFRRFHRIDSGVVGGPGTQFLWSLNYLVRSIFRSRAAGLIARTVALPVRLVDHIVPSSYSIDAAAGVFFLGRRHEVEVLHPQDMIAYYRGAQ